MRSRKRFPFPRPRCRRSVRDFAGISETLMKVSDKRMEPGQKIELLQQAREREAACMKSIRGRRGSLDDRRRGGGASPSYFLKSRRNWP